MKKEKDTSKESDILSAAKRIFERKGMDGARMQEIADEAGINKALLHYYYRSKQMLFEAVFKSAFLMLAPQLNIVLNDESSLFEKIRNFTKSYTSFILKHPYIPNFIIQELNRNPDFIKKLVTGKNFPNLTKFKQQVQIEKQNKLIKPIDPEQLFINIIALNLFPFLAAPLIKGFLQISDPNYQDLLEKRKTEVAEFIIDSIQLK